MCRRTREKIRKMADEGLYFKRSKEGCAFFLKFFFSPEKAAALENYQIARKSAPSNSARK